MTRSKTLKSPPGGKRLTYWVTRDSSPETGVVDDRVCVWLAPPKRYSLGERGAFWLAPVPDEDLYDRWSLHDCWYWCRTIPDDDRQCIRVEGDLIRGPDLRVVRPDRP